MANDYVQIFQQRLERLKSIKGKPLLIAGAIEYYKTHPVEFIEHWMVTYDPRNALDDKPTTMPFILFPRQVDYIHWLQERVISKKSGAVEKCRDAGITEVSTAFSIWAWLFIDGFSIGWGSRKEMLVDRIGDPDSIFEKLRSKIDLLPKIFLPGGLDSNKHFNYMKIINPANGNTITGEAGINIGRGGRKSMYFVDEFAHCEKQEKIAASLGDNTNTQILISSVNGINLFHSIAKANGGDDTFIFDWREDPRKNQDWYDERRADAEEKGLLAIFNQEVERDYLSAVDGIMIRPEWVRASIDAHIKLKFEGNGISQFGVDVSDEGGDKDSLTGRKGSIVSICESWNCKGDHDYSAGHATNLGIENSIDLLSYDSVGVGAGFKTAIKHIENIEFTVNGWNAGGGVVNPKAVVLEGKGKDKRTNKDFFLNARAQAWWEIRERFRKTFLAITANKEYSEHEMISICSEMNNREILITELCSPLMIYHNGMVKVESKKEMKSRGINSPDHADGFVMAFVPEKKGRQVRVMIG